MKIQQVAPKTIPFAWWVDDDESRRQLVHKRQSPGMIRFEGKWACSCMGEARHNPTAPRCGHVGFARQNTCPFCGAVKETDSWMDHLEVCPKAPANWREIVADTVDTLIAACGDGRKKSTKEARRKFQAVKGIDNELVNYSNR